MNTEQLIASLKSYRHDIIFPDYNLHFHLGISSAVDVDDSNKTLENILTHIHKDLQGQVEIIRKKYFSQVVQQLRETYRKRNADLIKTLANTKQTKDELELMTPRLIEAVEKHRSRSAKNKQRANLISTKVGN